MDYVQVQTNCNVYMAYLVLACVCLLVTYTFIGKYVPPYL